MRHDCKFFSSRTFGDAESVQRCELDAAPEAPWRCPEDCALFEKRLMEVGWDIGGMGSVPVAPDEPPGLDEHPDDIAALMADLEEIVDGAADGARAEAERTFTREQNKGKKRRFFRRRRD